MHLEESDFKSIARACAILRDLRVSEGVIPGASNELPRVNLDGLTLTLEWDEDDVAYYVTDIR